MGAARSLLVWFVYKWSLPADEEYCCRLSICVALWIWELQVCMYVCMYVCRLPWLSVSCGVAVVNTTALNFGGLFISLVLVIAGVGRVKRGFCVFIFDFDSNY